MYLPLSEFQSIRLKLMLMNPFEIIFLIGPPIVILWDACRKNGGAMAQLALWFISTLVGWVVLVIAVSYRFDLIYSWIERSSNPPQVLTDMTRGDGPKMLVAVVLGGVYTAVYYLAWLIILSPAIFLLGKRRKRKQRDVTNDKETPQDGATT